MKAPKELRHKLGARGENIAVKYLERKGYLVVTRNWKVKLGELDIIAVKDNKLYFVEVKTRTFRTGIEEYRTLSPHQAKRNRMAAKLYWKYLEEKPDAGHFDLIEIICSKLGFVIELKHTKDYQLPFMPLLSDVKAVNKEPNDIQTNNFGAALFFPCPLCGNQHSGKANSLCPECLKKLSVKDTDFACLICGKELNEPFQKCDDCKRLPWSGAASLFHYRKTGAELIKSLKFKKKTHLARTLADIAVEFLQKNPIEVDAIVTIPIPLLRLLSRGYNQSGVFADMLSKRLDIPVITPFKTIFFRKRQSSLNMRERARRRKNRFPVKDNCLIEGKRLLVVDDVFTTGATLKSACSALKKSGAADIKVLTCAYTPRYVKRAPDKDR